MSIETRLKKLEQLVSGDKESLDNTFMIVFQNEGETDDEAIERTRIETGKEPTKQNTLAIVKIIKTRIEPISNEM